MATRQRPAARKKPQQKKPTSPPDMKHTLFRKVKNGELTEVGSSLAWLILGLVMLATGQALGAFPKLLGLFR